MVEIKYEGKVSQDNILKKSFDIYQKDKMQFDDTNSILIEGDNFYAMSLLLNQFKNKVDLVYIDPPFNTSQKFNISTNRANSISKSKDSIVAYSDKLMEEEYLEFIRERLILLKELMSDEGSIYLHIDCKIGHYIKIIMDEVFGENNYMNDITRVKSNPKNFYRKAYGNEKDMILVYRKSYNNIWNDIKISLEDEEIIKRFPKIDANGRRYTTIPLHAPGETQNGVTGQPWNGIPVPEGRHWRTDPKEFDKLDEYGLIEWSSTGNPRIKKFADEHKGKRIQDIWKFKDPQKPNYPTQKNPDMIKQIILQSSNKDSIILDCFAGGGTTLECAHTLSRKWIGIDNSAVAMKVIKKNNLGKYNFYKI